MKTYKQFVTEIKKGKIKGVDGKACWVGYRYNGTENDKDDCVKIKENQSVTEGERGLWDNIHAKRERIKAGSGERMRKPGSKGAPTAQALKQSAESVEDIFDLIEDVIEDIAKENNVDSELIWEDLESITDEELFEVAAWQRKEGKNPEGGLNKAGIASYRRENPGSKLQMAVTTKPSKLKPGSKAANRRKSFCARMGGMKKRLTSAKTARDPDSRINKALRKWNC